MSSRLFFVGLRNFQPSYCGTRHNVGADALLNIARNLNLVWNKEGEADIANFNDQVSFILPRTYINTSGKAIGKFFPKKESAASQLVVVHDDLESKLGKVKLKIGGSAKGHNGVKSIIDNLGGRNDFRRILIGIGRPTSRSEEAVSNFVLAKFSRDEQDNLQLAFESTQELIEKLAKESN